MDQNAFRSLLSAPRTAGESSKRVLGGPAPKRAWAAKSKTGKEYEKKEEPKDEGPMLAPRAHQKKVAQGKYKDRAAMRREGLDDEYKPVEKLLEDMEQRAKDAGDDLAEVEKSRQYLGGDAEHSILVKGLDYSLLAARKAELARAKEEVADDELDALLGEEKAKQPEVVKPKQEEAVGKGFRSISQKDEEKPKKKKRKKVKVEASEASPTGPAATTPQLETKSPEANGKKVMDEDLPEVESKPEPDVDDIFGDAGEYDLTTGRVDDDSSDESDVEAGQVDPPISPQQRSRSHSVGSRQQHRRARSPSYEERLDRSSREHGRGPRHERSDSEGRYGGHRDRSMDRYRHSRDDSERRYRRERSDSRDRRDRGRRDPSDRYRGDRGDSRDRYQRRNDSTDRYARGRSDSRDRYRRDGSDSRDRYREDRDGRRSSYRDHSRDRQHSYRSRDTDPEGHRSRRRSPYPRQSKRYSRSPRGSTSRSPKRRRYSPSRSASPARNAPLRESRSPSPIFDPYAVQSRSPSPSSDEGQPFTGKLQPLASSAIADVKGFLSADASAAKAEEKRAKKAAWRARQGLGPQEGTEDLAKKDMNEKQKFNRDYVVLMNKMKKDEEGKEGKD